MLSVNIKDVAIITIKNVDCRCLIHNISKCESINWLKNSRRSWIYGIRYVFDWYKTQQMCEKTILETGRKNATKNNKYVIKLLTISLMHYNVLLTAIRLKKFAIKLLALILL